MAGASSLNAKNLEALGAAKLAELLLTHPAAATTRPGRRTSAYPGTSTRPPPPSLLLASFDVRYTTVLPAAGSDALAGLLLPAITE